jgi:hypothetical protein
LARRPGQPCASRQLSVLLLLLLLPRLPGIKRC